MRDLCGQCAKERKCDEPFAHYECDDFEPVIKEAEVVRLFKGLKPAMQKVILFIMEVTQDGKR